MFGPRDLSWGTSSQEVRRGFFVFASGRGVSIFLGFIFQLSVVRILAVTDFALYAVAAAAAVLIYSFLTFGIPTIVSYVGGSAVATGDWKGLRARWANLLALRLAVSVLFFSGTFVFVLLVPSLLPEKASPALIAATAGWSVAMLMFNELDTAAQLLGLQSAARIAAIFDPLTRLVGIFLLAILAPPVSALPVVVMSAFSMAIPALALVLVVARNIRQRIATQGLAPVMERESPVSRADAKHVALSSYASLVGAMLMSPVMVRLVAADVLPLESFAAFAFIQGLMASLLKLTSGMMFTQFIEPKVMTEFARNGASGRVAAPLALVFKFDLLIFGSLIAGLLASGPSSLRLLSGGRFGGYDLIFVWLLILPILYGLYRSLESAAAAAGCVRTLAMTLPVGAFWLCVMWFASHYAPMAAILIMPVIDASTRLFMLGAEVHRAGIRAIFNFRIAALTALVVAVIGFGARMLLAQSLAVYQIFGGAAAGFITLICLLFLIRPFNRGEFEILSAGNRRLSMILSRAVHGAR